MRGNPAQMPDSDVGLSVYIDKYGDVFITLVDLVALEDYALAGHEGWDGWGYNEYDGEYGWVIGSISGSRSTKDLRTVDVFVEVGSSVARKGWGPILYDSMLFAVSRYVARDSRWATDTTRGWTYPDQASVSEQARSVWLYYRTKRDDIDHRELPEKLEGWGRSDRPAYLLMAYSPNDLFSAELFYRMERNLADLLDRHNAEHEELKRQATKRGLRLFNDVYRKMRSGGPYPGNQR